MVAVLDSDSPKGSAKVASKAICLSYALMALWISLSATVILFNKYLLSYSGFPFPITLTMIHMLFCSLLTCALVHGGHLIGLQFEKVDMPSTTYLKYVLPIGALFSVALWLGNACYLYLSVSFIQMLKASMPVAVFIVSVLLGTTKYSLKTALNMAVVGTGIAVASYGEMNFVLIGVIFQIVAIFCESFRMVLIQMLMQHGGIKLNSIQTMYYVSPCCFLCLCIPFTFIEAPQLLLGPPIAVGPLLLAINAACAFGLNVSVYMLIGNTSALTLNVAGVVKDWLLILLSVLLFNSPVSTTSLLGYLIAFAGVKYYNSQRVADIKTAAEFKDQDEPVSKRLLQGRSSNACSISTSASMTPRSTG